MKARNSNDKEKVQQRPETVTISSHFSTSLDNITDASQLQHLPAAPSNAPTVDCTKTSYKCIMINTAQLQHISFCIHTSSYTQRATMNVMP